ncbi:response regulator [Fibrivirga algicola]|uniref:Response regulator n=1 Tax=Fibrivirga algicola TaxID=2950420 RepID=A0ABX0QDX5_9BACT|nr:response regulator [Fibrivirga algicola]ARK09474.1 Fis family transcriptional regulator [Fibrella sp. ES10-3-2-2]NID10351.1 response regulator [Fibrivirga algicola]
MTHILVVDDEPDVQPLFEQRFRREIRSGTVHMTFASSGEEALEIFNARPHEAVLILSDINMPGMSGLELLRHIRTVTPDRPPVVMMITAYGDAESHQQAMDLGADDFLAKPLDFNSLKEKLANLPV